MAKKSTNTVEKENKTMNTSANRVGMTTKDILNAQSSSVQLKSAPSRFRASGFAIAEDIDNETGEVRNVGYVVSEDGTVYGTISATAIKAIRPIIQAVNDGEFELPVEIGVAMRKSNAGRDFLTISVF